MPYSEDHGATRGTRHALRTRGRAPKRYNSTTACISCRQMKMKCEGGEDPPCARCCRMKRECRPQNPPQQALNFGLILGPVVDRNVALGEPLQYGLPASTYSLYGYQTASSSESYGSPSAEDERASKDRSVAASRYHARDMSDNSCSASSILPSIYSSPPIMVISGHRAGRVDYQSPISQPPSSLPLRPNTSSGILIPVTDLRDMVEMFCAKIVPFLPGLLSKEFCRDLGLLTTSYLPLAYCMCFVIAGFLPGGRSIRSILLPEISEIVKGRPITNGCRLDNLATIEALVILSLHAKINPLSRMNSEPSSDDDLSFWPLKYQTEMYALRLGLNKTGQIFRAELARSTPFEVEKYRHYLLWLQIFVNAHYTSILTGTPPTMRIDTSIRAAPKLLKDICVHPQTRLVAEIELCIIWDNISTHHPGFGEWWTQPDIGLDDNEAEAALADVDLALDAWYERWAAYINDTDGQGIILDYIGKFTRFGITTFGVRQLKGHREGLSSLQENQVRRCSIRAMEALDWPLRLGPVKTDQLRFVSDYSWIIVLFCCHFIIAASRSFSSIIPNVAENLDKVSQVAQLIIRLAVDQERMPYMEACRILTQVKSLQDNLAHETRRKDAEFAKTVNGNANSNTVQGQELNNFQIHDFSTLEPFWDFSTAFETGVQMGMDNPVFNIT